MEIKTKFSVGDEVVVCKEVLLDNNVKTVHGVYITKYGCLYNVSDSNDVSVWELYGEKEIVSRKVAIQLQCAMRDLIHTAVTMEEK